MAASRRRFRATVGYDGTDFRGWQRLATGRTVQSELEAAWEGVCGTAFRVIAAGRTDAGVHARGQVVHVDASWSRGLDELRRALNACLPYDVVVRSLGFAPHGFHARHSAIGRRYLYRIRAVRLREPLERRMVYHVRQPLDVGRMASAARMLVGRHDFGGFGKPMTPDGPTERVVDEVTVHRDGEHILVEMEANAFLRHQVRRTVGFLVDVGRGRFEPGSADAVLAREADAPIPRRAPAQGLVLEAVKYPPDDTIERDGAAGREPEGVRS